MSRDFELLQRLEREWGHPLGPSDASDRTISSARQNGTLRIAQERAPAARHSSEQLTPLVRSELAKLVLHTYLSTPPVKAVMFTGVDTDEGAKWIAACTADTLAETARARVCLVDADLQCPTIHRIYSVSNNDGLAALMAGASSIRRATIRVSDNLWILPAGAELDRQPLTREWFQTITSNLLEECDYLVIAAPDYRHYADIGALGAASEGAVLVLDAGKTHRVMAQQAKASLEAAKIKVLGSVLNNQNEAIPELFSLHM